jgi:hypothetical protein
MANFASGGVPQRVVGAGENAWSPSISRRGNQLAYWVWKQWDTIWRLELKDERHPLGSPVRLLSGRGVVWRPNFPPTVKSLSSSLTAWAIAIFERAITTPLIALN